MPSRNPLSADQIDAALADLDGWRRQSDGDTSQIVWERSFDDFRQAFAFLVRVAFVADGLDHHPEITNTYGDVRLALSTHDAGNRVTQTDLEMARQIDAL